jgi:hypothetical protein
VSTFVLSANADKFPVGATVVAYPRSNFPGMPHVPAGPPVGSSSASATVGSDGRTTLTSLADDTRYVAYASVNGQDRYVPFRTDPVPAGGRRVTTVASAAAPAINTDTTDLFILTAQTVDITSFTTNLTGNPRDGQTLAVAITGTASRAITWGASFEASTVALPTTTSSTARLDVGFVYNLATSKWRCISVA